ncbi:MAG: homocysteine biosynthesis protein [Fidelibacterota bacterium]
MTQTKSIDEINEKIKNGQAVVLTAEEVSRLAEECSPDDIVRKVDVVTTGTFGPMCSSGVFINFGHPNPPIRMQKIYLNDVAAYAGIAAVDAYLGATQLSESRPKYGGGHVIEELIAGKEVRLRAFSGGTDCYPRREIDTFIHRDSVNEIFMFNPRNAYQNYPAATNSGEKTIYTYMGTLRPHCANINYSTAGELSPLLNDPELRTIGIGTRIFLCGAQGYVAWNGTQFRRGGQLNESGVPLQNDATLAVIGDCKQMNRRFVKGIFLRGYGTSLFVGIGIPIPVLDVDIARRVSVNNRRIETIIRDYNQAEKPEIGRVSYAELLSGSVKIRGKVAKTGAMTNLSRAREIAEILKAQIKAGEFLLSTMVQPLPQKSSIQSLTINI